jgi:hypothetical protein
MNDRALAWTHLLPPGAILDLQGLPADLERALEPRIGPAADTLVSWGASPVTLAGLESYRSVVLVRPRAGVSAFLQARGFPHVRRFAVLPELRHARWYLPVGSRRVTTRAWDLYAPATAFGRVARLGMRLLTRAVGASMLGEELVVAARSPSAIEGALTIATGGGAFDLSIALPHEHGQRARLWLMVIDPEGTAIAYAKFAYRSQSIEQLEREAAFTRHVIGLSLRTVLVPSVLYSAPAGEGYLMVSAPLAASRASISDLDARHVSVLSELAGHAGQLSAGDLVESLALRCERLAGDLPSDWARRLARAVDAVASCEGLGELPTVLAHGDFVPWNIRSLPGDPRLAVFDWEQGQESQFLLWDAFNFLAQVDIVLRRPPAPQSARVAVERVGASPLARTFRLTQAQVSALYLAYLADTSARWFESHLPSSVWDFEMARTRTQPMRAAMLDAALGGEAAREAVRSTRS